MVIGYLTRRDLRSYLVRMYYQLFDPSEFDQLDKLRRGRVRGQFKNFLLDRFSQFTDEDLYRKMSPEALKAELKIRNASFQVGTTTTFL